MHENAAPAVSSPKCTVIESWKEIAAYFGVHVRTVQLWEAEDGMPVRRRPGIKGRVYADVQELNEWNRQREYFKPSQYPRIPHET